MSRRVACTFLSRSHPLGGKALRLGRLFLPHARLQAGRHHLQASSSGGAASCSHCAALVHFFTASAIATFRVCQKATQNAHASHWLHEVLGALMGVKSKQLPNVNEGNCVTTCAQTLAHALLWYRPVSHKKTIVSAVKSPRWTAFQPSVMAAAAGLTADWKSCEYTHAEKLAGCVPM